MSADRLVGDARQALAALAGLGVISLGKEAVGTWKGLAGRARACGLDDLGARMDALAAQIERRSALAFEPSADVAPAVLEVHDRVEALASALELWRVEAAFAEPAPATEGAAS